MDGLEVVSLTAWLVVEHGDIVMMSLMTLGSGLWLLSGLPSK
jgi:hypothetical protein